MGIKKTLIKGARLVNEGNIWHGGLAFSGQFITDVFEGDPPATLLTECDSIIDAAGAYLVPGAIDDQVHFREPGLTHKADIHSESRAAVAGGITSYMEMPNTIPNVTTQQILEQKYERAASTSAANYSFYMGATNDNLPEVVKTDPKAVCGVKVFMGSSTGNMLVDNPSTLEALFAECPVLLASHCEDEATIRANFAAYKKKYGEAIPPSAHPMIRSAEACYKSSSLAIGLAQKHNTRFHLLHISTARELDLLEVNNDVSQKRITAEACIHHLWFSDRDYIARGNFIKWNPAIKTEKDRNALQDALTSGRLDVVATDHAPHTLEEKQRNYPEAPSGGPLVQHAMLAMFELNRDGVLPLTTVVNKMCHNPARAFRINRRGFLRKDYFADLVLIDLNAFTEVTRPSLLYKCGWSPFEGYTFHSRIRKTWVNGFLAYDEGHIHENAQGMRLTFDS